MESIEVVLPDQLNDQGNGYFTVTWPRGATTVLSIQKDGSTQTRVQGTNGPYELCQIKSKGLLFIPVSTPYVIPYVDQ